ncbi:hypothetical protein JHK82_055848 [Glycine max]|nr:hypothetical protein JHK86_055671 [Glycine max]KAG4918395.1 hypothetical protein JHK85_056676 [Glycine max]KAG5074483.1 hypothetical protein JHK84_055714 [Glycine max]KAG5077153.1 hypothetical protein JHK82_055848 [Glycine max]
MWMEALSEILVRRASVECCAILLVSGLLVSRDIVDLLLTFMLSSWQSCMVFKLPGVEVSRKLSESDALNALDLVFDDNLMSHILINLSSTIFFSSITLIGSFNQPAFAPLVILPSSSHSDVCLSDAMSIVELR